MLDAEKLYSDPDDIRAEEITRSVEGLAALMDSRFKIPGSPINLGVDTIIGLVPGIGDTAGLLVSLFIIGRARQIGVDKRTLRKMGFNIGIDWLIGLIPVIGDLFDIGWKANNRNAALMRAHLDQRIYEGKNRRKIS